MTWRDSTLGTTIRYGLEFLGLGDRVAPFPVRRLARPWQAEEISVPTGWTPAAPDFVGVGTQKSGTSWWAGLIEQHPGVVPTRWDRKEMHYFTHFLETPLTPEAITTYWRAFARPPGRLCGEWTPNYLASPYTLPLIKRAAPEARILVMLRDPVRRFESGYNHEFKQRFGPIFGPRLRMSVVKRYALRKESIWMGMYGAQLDILLRHFPRERILVLQYERCRAEPAAMMRKTYAFLGLDPSFQPSGFAEEVNTQRRVTPPLSEDARSLLAEVYAADVQHVRTLFPDDIDLSLWSSFSSTGRAALPVPRPEPVRV